MNSATFLHVRNKQVGALVDRL